VFLMWPLETNEGDPLMYLLNQPETSGNIRCDPTIHVNERDFFIDSELERKSYLEMAGVAVTNNYYSRAGYHGQNYGGSGVYVEKSGSGGSSSSSSSASGSSGGGSYHYSSSSSGSRGGGHAAGGSYSGSGGGSRTQHSSGVLTQDEKRFLDADENQESTGDASYVHRQRAGAAQSGNYGRGGSNYYERTGGSSSGGAAGATRGTSQSSSSSWNSTSSNQGPTYTYSASRNRSGVLGPDGKWVYTEASTENYGNVVLAGGFGGAGGSSSGQSRSSSSASQGSSSRSYGQNQNVNYGETYSRTAGGSANVVRTGGAVRGNEG
jgi:hypothetical protein